MHRDADLRERVQEFESEFGVNVQKAAPRVVLETSPSAMHSFFKIARANQFTGMPLPFSVRSIHDNIDRHFYDTLTLPLVFDYHPSWMDTYPSTSNWEIARTRHATVEWGGAAERFTVSIPKSPPPTRPGDIASQFLSTASSTMTRFFETGRLSDANHIVLLFRAMCIFVWAKNRRPGDTGEPHADVYRSDDPNGEYVRTTQELERVLPRIHTDSTAAQSFLQLRTETNPAIFGCALLQLIEHHNRQTFPDAGALLMELVLQRHLPEEVGVDAESFELVALRIVLDRFAGHIPNIHVYHCVDHQTLVEALHKRCGVAFNKALTRMAFLYQAIVRIFATDAFAHLCTSWKLSLRGVRATAQQLQELRTHARGVQDENSITKTLALFAPRAAAAGCLTDRSIAEVIARLGGLGKKDTLLIHALTAPDAPVPTLDAIIERNTRDLTSSSGNVSPSPPSGDERDILGEFNQRYRDTLPSVHSAGVLFNLLNLATDAADHGHWRSIQALETALDALDPPLISPRRVYQAIVVWAACAGRSNEFLYNVNGEIPADIHRALVLRIVSMGLEDGPTSTSTISAKMMTLAKMFTWGGIDGVIRLAHAREGLLQRVRKERETVVNHDAVYIPAREANERAVEERQQWSERNEQMCPICFEVEDVFPTVLHDDHAVCDKCHPEIVALGFCPLYRKSPQLL